MLRSRPLRPDLIAPWGRSGARDFRTPAPCSDGACVADELEGSELAGREPPHMDDRRRPFSRRMDRSGGGDPRPGARAGPVQGNLQCETTLNSAAALTCHVESPQSVVQGCSAQGSAVGPGKKEA